MKFGFGIQLWLRNLHEHNFWRMLDEMALEGLDGFECPRPFLYEWFGDKPKEFGKQLAMHGLALSSYYTSGVYFTQEERERTKTTVKNRARFVAEAGFHNLLLDGGRKQQGLSEQEFDDYIKRIADTANELGEYANSLGLQLDWHQHWGSIFETKKPFYRFMELLDPKLCGFCCDSGQLQLGDFDILQTVTDFADRIRFMHYKDVQRAGRPEGELWPGKIVPSDEGAYQVDSKFRWVELGRGMVPYKEITKIMLAHGYDGWLVNDFDYTGYEPRSSVRACKEYINHALGVWTERDIREGVAPAGYTGARR